MRQVRPGSPHLPRRRLIFGALLLLFVASLAANLILYRQATRPLFEEGQQSLVDRTVASFAASGPVGAAEIRSQTRPIVMRLGDRTCVELRRHDGLGYQTACYDRGGGVIETIEGVIH